MVTLTPEQQIARAETARQMYRDYVAMRTANPNDPQLPAKWQEIVAFNSGKSQ